MKFPSDRYDEVTGKTRAEPETKMVLPPDPDDMNDQRAAWARVAVQAFMQQTGQTSEAEALGDLLVDLRHLVDRIDMEGRDPARFFARAEECYQVETEEETAE